MKYIFCFCFVFFAAIPAFGDVVQLTNLTQNNDYIPANYLRELNFAEKQIFQENRINEPVLSKLEKLEIALFGAIQVGETAYRIGNVYKSCRDIYGRGYGEYYFSNGRNFYRDRRLRNYHSPYKPVYRNIYHPYYYDNTIPIQTLPQNYSLGTTIRILD